MVLAHRQAGCIYYMLEWLWLCKHVLNRLIHNSIHNSTTADLCQKCSKSQQYFQVKRDFSDRVIGYLFDHSACCSFVSFNPYPGCCHQLVTTSVNISVLVKEATKGDNQDLLCYRRQGEKKWGKTGSTYSIHPRACQRREKTQLTS